MVNSFLRPIKLKNFSYKPKGQSYSTINSPPLENEIHFHKDLYRSYVHNYPHLKMTLMVIGEAEFYPGRKGISININNIDEFQHCG